MISVLDSMRMNGIVSGRAAVNLDEGSIQISYDYLINIQQQLSQWPVLACN